MCRSRTIPRGEFLWQGSCPDRDVVMVPVRAFHADPVYGIAHPVDLEGKCPGQEVERDFSLGYRFTRCHLYACLRSPGDIPSVPLKLPSPFLPGLSGVFGEGGRTPVPGIAVILSTIRSWANSRSSLLTWVASFREPSMPSCLICVDPMLSLPLLSARVAGKFQNTRVSEIITYPRADRARSSSSPGQTRPCIYGTTPGCPRRRDFYQAIYIHSNACVYQKRTPKRGKQDQSIPCCIR